MPGRPARYAKGANRMERSTATAGGEAAYDTREPWQKQRDARRAAKYFPAWMHDPDSLPKDPPGRAPKKNC